MYSGSPSAANRFNPHKGGPAPPRGGYRVSPSRFRLKVAGNGLFSGLFAAFALMCALALSRVKSRSCAFRYFSSKSGVAQWLTIPNSQFLLIHTDIRGWIYVCAQTGGEMEKRRKIYRYIIHNTHIHIYLYILSLSSFLSRIFPNSPVFRQTESVKSPENGHISQNVALQPVDFGLPLAFSDPADNHAAVFDECVDDLFKKLLRLMHPLQQRTVSVFTP